MCVIIHKQAGQEIPFEHLLGAAHRNSDGWGVVIPDRGQLEVFHGLDTTYRKHAEDVAELLEAAKDHDAFVHFRLCTAGDRSVAMTHPFTALSKKDDGVDLQVMHNGTISEFNRTGQAASDTALFTEKVIRPALLREYAYLQDEEELLRGTYLKDLLSRYTGLYSVVTLISPHGELTLNKDRGVQQPYGWASNDYYIPHKSKTTETTHANCNVYYTRARAEDSTKKKSATSTNTWGEKVRNAPKDVSTLEDCLPAWRATACELCNVQDLRVFQHLTAEELKALVIADPEISATLIMDLLYELYAEGDV